MPKARRIRPDFWSTPEVIAAIKRHTDGIIPTQTELLRELRQVEGGANLHQGTLSNRLRGKRKRERDGAPAGPHVKKTRPDPTLHPHGFKAERKATPEPTESPAEARRQEPEPSLPTCQPAPERVPPPEPAPGPIEVVTLKTRYLANNLLCVTDETGVHHTLTKHSKLRSDGAAFCYCNGCHTAKYGEQIAARYAGRPIPPANEGPIKRFTISPDGQHVLSERNRHHQDCVGLTEAEVEAIQVTREEQEFIEEGRGNAWAANMDKTWFGSHVLFDMREWGHFTNEGHRTNNVPEGCHSRMQRAGAPINPKFSLWIDWMKGWHTNNLHTALRWSLGFDAIPPKPVYLRLHREVQSSKLWLTYRLGLLNRIPTGRLLGLWNFAKDHENPPRHSLQLFIRRAWETFRGNAVIYAEDIKEMVQCEIVEKHLVRVGYLLADPESRQKEKLLNFLERGREYAQRWGTKYRPPKGKKTPNERNQNLPKADKRTPKTDERVPKTDEQVPKTDDQVPKTASNLPQIVLWGGRWWKNSCPIDNPLMCLNCHLFYHPTFLHAIPYNQDEQQKLIYDCLRLFRDGRIVAGKSLVVEYLGKTQKLQDEHESINLEGSEHARWISVLQHVWRSEEQSICSSDHCPNRASVRTLKEYSIGSSQEVNVLGFSQCLKRLFECDDAEIRPCHRRFPAANPLSPDALAHAVWDERAGKYYCDGLRRRTGFFFSNGMPWMIPIWVGELTVKECFRLPTTHTINGRRYTRVGVSLYSGGDKSGGHFTCILRCSGAVDKKMYYYDGMRAYLRELSTVRIVGLSPKWAYYLLVPN